MALKSGNLGNFGTNTVLRGWFVRIPKDFWVLSQEYSADRVRYGVAWCKNITVSGFKFLSCCAFKVIP